MVENEKQQQTVIWFIGCDGHAGMENPKWWLNGAKPA